MDNESKILVVDDEPVNIEVLIEALERRHQVIVAINGERALKLALTEPQPDLILLDVVMPGLDGYEVCRRLKDDPRTARIPVIFVTVRDDQADEERGLGMGAVDYITKPFSLPIVQARVATHLALHDQSKELERRVGERTEELVQSRLEIVQHLARAVELKDYHTGLHVVRMSHYSRIIAEAYSHDPVWADLIFNAAPMHDVGKIGIPDHILTKPGKLTPEEWELMKSHPTFGAKILSHHTSGLLGLAREIALTHHEGWTGKGYPQGLAGTDIPISGRIVAIADVFDALTSKRSYKEAWPEDQAVAYIADHRGRQFDPDLVDIFLAQLPAIREIRLRYRQDEDWGAPTSAVP